MEEEEGGEDRLEELTTTTSEKKKSIELREEQSRGLMDSNEHGLSAVVEKKRAVSKKAR